MVVPGGSAHSGSNASARTGLITSVLNALKEDAVDAGPIDPTVRGHWRRPVVCFKYKRQIDPYWKSDAATHPG